MGMRTWLLATWLLALTMLVAAPAGDVVAQRAPEKPARETPPPKRPAPEKPPRETPPAKPPAREQPAEEPRSCCRVCSKGKACGNSCISRRFECHQPVGCACDAGSS